MKRCKHPTNKLSITPLERGYSWVEYCRCGAYRKIVTRYQTGPWRWGEIYEVEVDKSTDISVWIKGRRNAKESSYEFFAPTWDEAHKHLLKEAEDNVASARKALELAQSKLGNIRGMIPGTISSSR